MLPEAAELVERADHLVDELHQRMGELETQLLEERAAREQAEDEKVQAEQRLLDLQAELDRLKGRR